MSKTVSLLLLGIGVPLFVVVVVLIRIKIDEWRKNERGVRLRR